MSTYFSRSLVLALAGAMSITAPPALAADGLFLIGYGARQKALAGAGVADSRDAMALSVNPAGIVGLERQLQSGMTAAIGDRGYSTKGLTRIIAPGDVRSGRPLFPIPNSGYIHPIDADSALSFVSYANGGLNTAYSFGNFKAPLGGPFGGGFSGVDLSQSFMSLGYARRFATGFGAISIGVAPTFAAQSINIQGLKIFGPYSSNQYKLSDMGHDWSFGGGLRVGLEWRITDRLRLGVAGATPMFMSKFGKYAGLIVNGGAFDIPASLQAGLAYDVLPDVTIMADWRHIFYSAVPSLGNPANPVTIGSLGTANGPGFDWKDTNSAAFGVEWRASRDLTLRGGYHYSTNPLRGRAVLVNTLSPALHKHHVGGGLNYKVTNNSSIDFTTVYVFKNSFTGVEALPQSAALPFGGVNPAASITVFTRAVEFTVGYNYKYDAGDHSWIPSHF